MNVLVTLLAALLVQDHGGKVRWSRSVQSSLNSAERAGKPAMLLFTADW